ncbi:MAG: TauD/TfdA family dioxygenase, partial [Limnohabitans sp.]|nr:TauD/TfdA family dioxygenase [Limnohabitans sp.]
MSLIMKQAITGPAVWKGADMVGDTTWVHVLSPEVLATLDAALAHVKSKGLTFPNFGREDFPIGVWAQDLKTHSDELENGRGFLVLRGLLVERYSEEDIQIIYYGIGLHMGVPVRQ